jgi:serine/threonine protein kinase/Tol biopolymer transport system component
VKAPLPARFGPYEIVGQIGAGGMGEVYRARDTRLHREVALKILPESAAANPDRQRRFTQEAITAGSLNHPNILAVYDVGVEDATPYLVSELVEGTSLRHEMNQGRMPVKRLLDLSMQIADGLAAAHAAGIVHRDLKPENVMVTRDGRVKILDFGLAKVADEDVALENPSLLTQTAPGLIVGTVPYMSPEQARGGRADFRSDQFSLGVVMYEMASGTHPFRRDTAVQTLAAVIDQEPPALSDVSVALPAPLRWVIARLLAKKPAERYAHTADLAAELRTIRDHLTEALTPANVPRPAAGRRPALAWVALALAAAAATFAVGRFSAPAGVDLTTYKFTPLATDAGFQGAPAFSPDGKTIAYVAEVDGVLQVFTRSLASSTRFQVTRSRFDCRAPFWSPDGTRIYYHSLARDQEALWFISPAGGSPELLIEKAVRGAMSPDGRVMAFLRPDSPGSRTRLSLWLSSAPGAEPTRFPDFYVTDGELRFSPDGSRLLVWATTGIGFDIFNANNGFWSVRLPAGKPIPIMRAFSGARVPTVFSWLPDGRHIVMANDDGRTPGIHLWLADVDTGVARPLTITSGSEGAPSVAADGTRVAFTSEATDFDLLLVPIDGSAVQTVLSSTRNELDPAWSLGGSQHAFVTDRTGRQEIWLRNQDGEQRPLVTDADFEQETAVYGSLAFSPDGQRLAYQRMAPATGWRIWISTLAGGSPVRLTTSAPDVYQDAPTWSPDGEWLAFVAAEGDAPADGPDAGRWSLVKTRFGSGAAPRIRLASGVAPFARPQWSPDGRWIACLMMDGLTLVSADGKDAKIISDTDWIAYGWSIDSARVFGMRPADDLHHLTLVSLDIQSGQERIVNPNIGTLPQANQPIRGFSRVGTRGFATSIARVRSDIWLLEGLQLSPGWRDRLWPFNRGRAGASR